VPAAERRQGVRDRERRDNTTSVEIVLDAAAGEARAEVVTVEREASLFEMSRKLEHAGDDDGDADGDDAE
jgi:hypothetical protein